jgi:hypothetical protein
MPSRNPKLHLGESWVVEGENESPENSPKDEEYVPAKRTPLRRTSARGTRSPEPELVMPSLDLNSLDGSWADTTSRSTRFPTTTRSAERAQEARRRNTQSGTNTGSPEKRARIKKAPSNHVRTREPTLSQSNSSIQDVMSIAFEHIIVVMSWLFEVFAGALRVLKKPLSYFLAIWLLFGLLVIVRNLVTNSVYASLSPVCRIPGASLLNLPFCPVYRVDTTNGPPPTVEFDQLMTVQSKFEEVLEESAGGVTLPLDMKRGEASIRDLRQLVRYSQLHSKYVQRYLIEYGLPLYDV